MIQNKKVFIPIIVALGVVVGGFFIFHYSGTTRQQGAQTQESFNMELEAEVVTEPAVTQEEPSVEQKEKKAAQKVKPGLFICSERCGDGICQASDTTCAEGDPNCICQESFQECPQDCPY